jgi:benzylsuccinate CoA-transferase BbsF subunit
MSTNSLEGIRVLDFGTAWAGPMAAHILADMGAEVIKVESRTRIDGARLGRPIVGDDIDGGDKGKWVDMQPQFHGLNRNKYSITVNLKRPEGMALIKELIKKSDVVLDNSSPGVMKRLGLDYESLKKIKPDIITISLSGLGGYGPFSNAMVYAPIITAISGLVSQIGYYGEPVLGAQTSSYGDCNASIHGVFATLAALYYRKRTGEGQHIDLSEVEADTSTLGETILDYTMNHRVAKPRGNNHPSMVPHNNYRCKGDDKWISIAIKTEEEWKRFCQVIGNPDWTKEQRFADTFSRLHNRDELDTLITEWTINYTPYEAMEILQEAGVAAVPVMNVEDQYFDPHFKERQTFVEVNHPLVGLEVLYGFPFKLSKTPAAIHRVCPSLGEHNNYVFGKLLGLSQDEIDRLTKDKVLE